MDAGGDRTLISWLQARSLPVRRRARFFLSRRGKGSNLQPRPSESRALVRLSYRNFFYGPGRIRTCTNLILSQAPLPIGLLNRLLSTFPSLLSDQCTGQESNLHGAA
jgi:hypothetical protein